MRRYKNEHTGETIIVSSEISGGGWVEVKDEATPKKTPVKKSTKRE